MRRPRDRFSEAVVVIIYSVVIASSSTVDAIRTGLAVQRQQHHRSSTSTVRVTTRRPDRTTAVVDRRGTTLAFGSPANKSRDLLVPARWSTARRPSENDGVTADESRPVCRSLFVAHNPLSVPSSRLSARSSPGRADVEAFGVRDIQVNFAVCLCVRTQQIWSLDRCGWPSRSHRNRGHLPTHTALH